MPFEGPKPGDTALLQASTIRALCVAGLLTVAVVAGTSLFGPGHNPPRAAHFDPIDLGGLPEIRSHNGVLQTTLVAAPLDVHIGSATFRGAAYNGIYGGPVLRVNAGDLIRIHLVNHMPDGINLHFHGLRVTPLGRGDNMHILVAAGDSYDYEFRIPPNHPPGLFWYHDHAHGAAEPHVMAGLSGALLIEGFAAQIHGLEDVPQTLLVLKDWQHNDCTAPDLKHNLHCRLISINGAADWQDKLTPGQTQLWRVSNQGADLILHLAAPGLHLRIVGRDGMPATGGQDTDKFDIMPASRVDVLARSDTEGSFPLVAVGVPTSGPAGFSVKRNLGSVTVAGARVAAVQPELSFPHQLDMRAWQIDASRTIVFSENIAVNEYYVNGRKFDPLRTDVRAPLGNVEEWTIRNVTQDFHEFHIHQLSFQVTEINGARQDFTGYVDDVKIPEHGEVKVIIPFTDPNIVGHLMFHCHVLNHEDRGMMTMLEVYRPGVPHICRTPPAN
jgi:FtsP/CotA-like multicopper oxidase with cupredoxin domain